MLTLDFCTIIELNHRFAESNFVVTNLNDKCFSLKKISISLNLLLLCSGILWGITCIVNIKNSYGWNGLESFIGLLFCPIIFAISAIWSLINFCLCDKNIEKKWLRISSITGLISILLIFLFLFDG